MLQLLTADKIDHEKWNATLANSSFRHPALQSWYLDIVAPQWVALVSGDYSACMPLPLQRKYGIPYVAKPEFVQQMGVFSQTENAQEQFYEQIRQLRWLFEYPCNETNICSVGNITEQNNYCIDLALPYETLRKLYNKNTKRNINKARTAGLRFYRQTEIDRILPFFAEHVGRNPVEQKHVQLIASIAGHAIGRTQLRAYCVASEDGELLASAVFLTAFGRSVYLLATSSDEGIAQKAMFLLIDEYIKEHAGVAGRMLDFEGSNIEGIARFYRGFGAENRPYPFVRFNNLRLPGKIALWARSFL